VSFKLAIGIYGIENLFGGDFTRVVDVVARADRLGIDHVVMGERTDRYPYGTFPVPPAAPWYEPIVALSAFAAVTDRIRLSTSVVISPLRPPVLFAKQIATLDVLSHGRLDLGVGTGWQREEYAASMLPFEGRGQRLEDQLRACQVLWRDAPARFHSKTVSFDGIYCRPAPVQPGGVPLWFGLAPTEVNCRRIAELGVGWLPISQDPSELERGVASVRAAFEAAGRDPTELQVRAQLLPRRARSGRAADSGAFDLEATLEGIDATLAAGATVIEVLPFLFCRSPDELDACLDRIARLPR
jgi:probable F420-dependent oxidoreductase